MPKLSRRYFSHCISQVRAGRAQYSASEDDHDIVDCFFDFQQTRGDLIQKPETDRLV